MVATSDGRPPPFDDRPFVRLDHGMPENPKIVGLSDAAFRLYVEAICWCSRQETDGKIPAAMMRRLGKARSVTELVKGGLLDEVLGDYEVHDYLEFQRSRDEIAEFRESRSDRGKRGNHSRWHVARRRYDPECEFCNGIAGAIANGSQQGSLVRSLNPSDPIADTDADADAAISSISPWSDGDGDQASNVTHVPRGRASLDAWKKANDA